MQIKKIFIAGLLILVSYMNIFADNINNKSVDNTITIVSFINGIISNFAELEKQTKQVNFKLKPSDKNLIESAIKSIDTELSKTIVTSNQIIKNLKNEIVFYKSNKELADTLLDHLLAEEARLKDVYLKQQTKLYSLKALNTVGTVINLYTFKQSIDNIVNKVEESKRLTKFDYLDVLSAIISFNPIGAAGSQLYNLEKEFDKAMDISNSINDVYRESLWKIRDQYFKQYHILATRGYKGAPKNNFIELFKKQRVDLREQIINLLQDVENTVILTGKDETIRILSSVYDLIAPDKEQEITAKQNQIYDKFYQYYLDKQNILEEQKNIQKLQISNKHLNLSDRININIDKQIKSKIFLILEPGSTIDSSGAIKTEVGNKVELIFSASGEGITDFVKEAFNKKQDVVLWYDDLITQERKAITFKVDDIGYTDGFYPLYFEAPSKEFRPINISYYNDEKDEDITYDLNVGINVEYSVNFENNNEDIEYDSVDFNTLEHSIMVEINGELIEDEYQAKYLVRFTKDGELSFIRFNLEKDKECQDKDEESTSTNQINICNPVAIDIVKGGWSFDSENDILVMDFNNENEFEVELKDGKLEKNMQLLGEKILKIYKASELSLQDFSGRTITFFSETGKYNYWTFGPDGKLQVKNDTDESTIMNWSLKDGANGKYLDITNNGESVLKLYDNTFIVGDLLDMYGYRGMLMGTTDDPDSIRSNIYLISENYKDYTIQIQEFTKEWTFDQDISNFDIEVVSNTYANSLNKDNFTKDGKTLKVNLFPDTPNPINKLLLKFTKDGNPVKVNGSETFWSLTKTNHAPRLADGQITQLVSATDEPAVLDIETYDGDGDSVTLSIKDNAGGTVRLNGNQLTASFTDGKTEHTIKIGLNDGKERVIKEFHVLQFDSSSIKDFYSDVSINSSYPFDGIAFGTLKGVIWGQSDPDSPLKRIFRPTDDASMAEVLAMIVNAEKKAGFITLESSNYYMDVYPNWAMPYYTFARDHSAISQIRDLASYYPIREEIAKIIVKTLGLEDQIGSIALENSFEDEEDFSSNSMLYYAKIARFFGLFMTETEAKPKEHINRAELAVVIEKIFMIPDANISFDPATVEYGDNLIPVVSDIKAQSIDSNYNLVDNSKNVGVRYIYNDYFINAPIDTSKLLPSTQSVKVLISNQNVKRLVDVPVTITFTDQDHDGVQDREDKWTDDPRYAFDTNKNDIPDILDEIYNLSDYNANSIVNFDGQLVKVSDIIRDGTYVPDLDGDGIVDSEDTDDDNDGISDADEIKYGLNPRDGSDATKDNDGDGVSNIDEIAAKTDPNDKTSYPTQPQKMVKVELKRGWNLMGMDTNLTLAEIKSLIGDDNLDIIQGASKTYKKEYLDNGQEFLNDFEKFEEGKGYWIKVVKDVTFEYPQVRSKKLTIPLSKGWNLINPTAEMPVKAIQDQIGMQHLFIIQGASKTYKKEYLDNGQEFLNDFEKFEEPKGYWIKVDQDTVLEFTE